MNAPNLGDLGSFPTQGAPRQFRVGPPKGSTNPRRELTRLLVRFADGVVVAVVVAQTDDGLGGSIGSMGKPWSYPSSESRNSSFIMLMPWTLAPAVSSEQRSAISVLLQSGRRRRPQAVTRPWWPWRRQNPFEAFGGRATSKLPFTACTPSNPQTHEIQVFHSHSRLSKGFCDPCLGHDTIWRPGQGDEGICRQRKYVDK